jgi:hypothetical protein
MLLMWNVEVVPDGIPSDVSSSGSSRLENQTLWLVVVLYYVRTWLHTCSSIDMLCVM